MIIRIFPAQPPTACIFDAMWSNGSTSSMGNVARRRCLPAKQKRKR
jgi:hypothetical protein